MRNISAGAVLAEAYFPGDVLFPVAFSPVFLQATTALIVKALRATRPGQADQAAYEAPGGGTVPVMEYAVFAWRPPNGGCFSCGVGTPRQIPLPFGTGPVK